uniref:Uncharacterized protein n=1 Tax=Alexandrium monilatum TaxID=311494 RepID=A0A7S4PSN1_9DINO
MAGRTADWFTVECLQAFVRRAPSLDAPALSVLRLGDEVQAVAAAAAAPPEPEGAGQKLWMRVPWRSLVDRLDGRGPVPLDIPRDGWVLASDPESGEEGGTELLLPRRHWHLFELDLPGCLTREELRQHVRGSDAVVLPLEARLWAPSELRHALRGGPAAGAAGGARGGAAAGLLGPSGGAPAAAAAAPTEQELGERLERAARWLSGAEALLVAVGEDLGDAGLWPGLGECGIGLEQACSADWFRIDPRLGWAFWDFCRDAARARPLAEAVRGLCDAARRARAGACLLTSSWEGSWAAAGWEGKLVELHGSLHWWQCSQPDSCGLDVWRAERTDAPGAREGAGAPLDGGCPACPGCGAAARPNVRMYGGDYAFSKRRVRAQMSAYNSWLRALEPMEGVGGPGLVCVEIECGLAVPTLRREVESVMRRFRSARLVRISTESIDTLASLEDRCAALPFPADVALEAIHAQQYERWRAKMATFVIWDEEGGGTEVLQEREASVRSILSTAARAPGAAAVVGSGGCEPVRVVAVSQDMGKGRRLTLDRRVPPWCFFEDPRPPRPGCGWRAAATAVLRVPGGALPQRGAGGGALWARVDEARGLLAELAERGGGGTRPDSTTVTAASAAAPATPPRRPAGGAVVPAERRARGRLLAEIAAAVLPRHGLPPDEAGQTAAGCLLAAAACGDAGLSAAAEAAAEAGLLPARLVAGLPPARGGAAAAARGARARPPLLRHDDWELGPPGGPRFGIVGTWDDWRRVHDMLWDGACYRFYVQLGASAWESFQILQDGSWDCILFPNCRDGNPHVPHALCGPRKGGGHGKNWSIGIHKKDGAVCGSRYAIRLQVYETGAPKRVEWTKLDSRVSEEEEDASERGFFQAGPGATTHSA